MPTDPARVATARQLLTQLGVSIADLQADTGECPGLPTFAEYIRAIADGLLDATASPAHRVAKPRRLPTTRRALTPPELEEINLAARTSGNDVILDALLLRLHTETACSRGGALGLRLIDLDVRHGLVRLTVKGGRCAGSRLPSTWPCIWMTMLVAAARFSEPGRSRRR